MATCYRCAAATFRIAPRPCPVCSQDLGEGDWCRNKLCRDPNRYVDRITAAVVKTGPIDQKVQGLKYHGLKGWATIFGRILVGHVAATWSPGDVDLIVANPTFLEPGKTRHTELVIEAAAREDLHEVWPWDVGEPRALVKTGPSPQSAGGTYPEKLAAADALVPLLAITDPARTAGKRVLVYDDICTTGLQLDRVARVLKEWGGAARVEGVVLARAPWR